MWPRAPTNAGAAADRDVAGADALQPFERRLDRRRGRVVGDGTGRVATEFQRKSPAGDHWGNVDFLLRVGRGTVAGARDDRFAAEAADEFAFGRELLQPTFVPNVDVPGRLIDSDAPVVAEAVFADVVRRWARLADLEGAEAVHFHDSGSRRSTAEWSAAFDDGHLRGVLGRRSPEDQVGSVGAGAPGPAFDIYSTALRDERQTLQCSFHRGRGGRCRDVGGPLMRLDEGVAARGRIGRELKRAAGDRGT